MVAGNVFGAVPAHPNVQMKRAGQIARGNSVPNLNGDYPGAVYIDVSTRRFYFKRMGSGTAHDTWGNWVYEIPPELDRLFYAVKWYGEARPSNDLGVDGDFYLMWYCDNPSICPRVFGPKLNGEWPENGDGTEFCGDPFLDFLEIGATDEGAVLLLDWTSPIVHVGAVDETEWYVSEALECFVPRGPVTMGEELCMALNPDWNKVPV